MKDMTIQTLSAALREGKTSSFAVVGECLNTIKEKDPAIGAFLSVFEEEALASAKAFDNRRDEQKWSSPLAGIPVAIKDNLMVAGKKATCGSQMLENFVSPYDATVVAKLKTAGAIIVGKTNMDEFGMGSTTENSAFRITCNPLDLTRVSGGSSGGSCAAVAAGMVPMALGSDTGGSVRLPASYQGLVGMRPTYGAVSRYGLTAFCSSMDTVGPITKTVKDNELVYRAIAGKDEKDATSRALPPFLPEQHAPLRVGVIRQLTGDQISPAVRGALQYSAKCFSKLGAWVEEVSIPEIDDALSAYYVISSAEASSNLARFDGVRYGHRAERCRDLTELYQKSRSEGFGEEVKRRIRLGTFALTKENKEAFYERSMLLKRRLCAAFERVFEKYDLLLCPTAPDIAPEIRKLKTPEEMYAVDLCTVPMSLAGLPCLCLPSGKEENGLPIGIQLTGRAFSEGLLYEVGKLYEREGQ